jgi:hypothetical protein
MMAPLWTMLLTLAALFLIFLAVYMRAGDRPLERVIPAAGISAVLTAVVGAIRYMQHGYTVLGMSGPWAWAFALTHTLITLLIVARGTYIVRRAVVAPPHPFLSKEDLRYLSRRPRTWSIARILMPLSAVLVVVVG